MSISSIVQPHSLLLMIFNLLLVNTRSHSTCLAQTPWAVLQPCGNGGGLLAALPLSLYYAIFILHLRGGERGGSVECGWDG